jgi:predicted nuclease with TOPRIM domain
MLKRKITKADYDALPDALKEHYNANGDHYLLDADDARELLSARDAMKAERDEAKAKLAETERQLAEVTKDKGDLASLRESYEAKLSKLKKELDEVNTTLTAERREHVVGAKARELAAKHFTVPSLVAEILARRMDIDPKDPKALRILDKDGKLSALTEDDLIKEFVDNPEYKAIVIANRASGSAGNSSAPPGSAGNPPFNFTTPDGKPKRLSQMSAAERAAYIKTKTASPEGGNTPGAA